MVFSTSPNQLSASGGKQSSGCEPDNHDNGKHEARRQFFGSIGADFGSRGEYARGGGNTDHHDNDHDFGGSVTGGNHDHGRA